jgi:hypothetical protein
MLGPPGAKPRFLIGNIAMAGPQQLQHTKQLPLLPLLPAQPALTKQ